MKQSPSNEKEYEVYEEMFENITDVSWSKNIAPFSTDIKDIAKYGRMHHADENIYLESGAIRPFNRTLVMNLPIEVRTQEGKCIPLECKIWSRTIQDLINRNIVANIRSAKSIDLLDVNFEFCFGSEELSEYYFDDKEFYKKLKKYIIQFIKKSAIIEAVVVDNYCDGLDATLSYVESKEPLVHQREKTTRELCEALGMPKSFVLSKDYRYTTDAIVLGSYGGEWEKLLSTKQKNAFKRLLRIGHEFSGFTAGYETKRYIEDIQKENENIKEIMRAIQDKQTNIQLDSKFFFLDNGDNLYDDIIENSLYNEYYGEELSLIGQNKDKIILYLKNKYIGMGCGNGKKDYTIISDNIDTGRNPHKQYAGSPIGTVMLMDSSLRSLSKAEKLISDHKGERGISLGSTTVMFSQEWIDVLANNDTIKTLTSVTHNPHESICNMPDIKESSNMFTLFGGTFGNFLGYKKIFLQQMNTIMNDGDVLCVSLFNPPKNEQEKEEIIKKYNTHETHIFIKNFFIKLGIPEDAIEVLVGYDRETETIHIDAKIHRKNNQPISIHPTGENVLVPDGTVFHCIPSQRMDENDMQKDIDQSQTSLKIIDRISSPGNPFTLYIISK